ncbi:undecaprenyl pyrophosphate synthetase [Taylorella asinigenitalis 14/45]|uniref:Isoprenyl transferase n=1 Tax=Taylorella asinigenitalis 14/45 TaxID=1091495 RepID=I7IK49_9BURK|nr:polyprenyl diphosphate synthase [Taylorella asinigenitalis]CCG18906.1 undecaprenyl pyrophosphate synthetase [Taylorella asinigenitalis 14/45]
MLNQSSTLQVPTSNRIPKHIAIIMDGNGRWAQNRNLPRTSGHVKGVQSVRNAVEFCIKFGVSNLTIYAFSSENWRRPQNEVNLLMKLFKKVLTNEVSKLHKNNIRLRIVGDRTAFTDDIQTLMQKAEELTQNNSTLCVNICANYGGRWDILNAINNLIKHNNYKFNTEPIKEEDLAPFISLNDIPEPDLCIRTGGEYRLSNFLLWQTAYSELYFTDKFWPDMKVSDFEEALKDFQSRERRFGMTSDQV